MKGRVLFTTFGIETTTADTGPVNLLEARGVTNFPALCFNTLLHYVATCCSGGWKCTFIHIPKKLPLCVLDRRDWHSLRETVNTQQRSRHPLDLMGKYLFPVNLNHSTKKYKKRIVQKKKSVCNTKWEYKHKELVKTISTHLLFLHIAVWSF